MKTEYAPEGWNFYSVQTPNVFFEALIPYDDALFTPSHQTSMERLGELAEMHSTHVTRLAYRRG